MTSRLIIPPIALWISFIFWSIAAMPQEPGIVGGQGQLPENIVIINAFDALSLPARKAKKELFRELADSLMQYLRDELHYRKMGEPVILPELLRDTLAIDSLVFDILRQQKAYTAIVIRNLNVHFEQTGVEVTKEPDGKNREASYDICSTVIYDIYSRTAKLKSARTNFCEFFTKRNVLSGLFAAGPDVVGKRKHTYGVVNKNAARFVLNEYLER
jgi:hypothetical protein